MAKITDWIKPEIVSGEEFADAMNANCSFRTDTGRELKPHEIALLMVYRLQKQVAELKTRLDAMEGGK